jgi:CPA2 family monovalent cation:H+ antiporter-2
VLFRSTTIGLAVGWGLLESIFLGALICDSSTTVLIKILNELQKRDERYADLVLGATVIEDILAIVIIAVLTGMGVSGKVELSTVSAQMAMLVTFLIVMLVGGLIAVPKFLNIIARFRSNELFIISVIGLCFGTALVAMHLHFTLALGAFIIGAIISETRYRARVEFLTDPLKDIFGAVFFVAMGLLVHIADIWQNALPIVLLTLAIIIGKFIGSSGGALIAGEDTRTCVKVGCCMAQVNEFALIIAGLGQSLKIMPSYVYPTAVMAVLFTTFINPYLIRNSDLIANILQKFFPSSSRRFVKAYTQWAGKMRETSQQPVDSIRRAIARSIMIIVVNFAWMAAIYLLLTRFYFAIKAKFVFAIMPKNFVVQDNTIFWMLGGILCVPFFVASFRKIQALAMIFAEWLFPLAREQHIKKIRRMFAGTVEWLVTLSGTALLILSIILFSKPIAPPPSQLLIGFIILGIVAVGLWTLHIKVYARFQNALHETLQKDNLPMMFDPLTAWSYLFRDVKLMYIDIPHDSPATFKKIAELELRSKTGTTILGMERDGKMILNPHSSEHFKPGDRVMLVGTPEQLANAKNILAPE